MASPLSFQAVEHTFVALFTIEIVVRATALQTFRRAIRDRWFVFDSVLVITMIMEIWVLTIFGLIMGNQETSSVGTLSMIRILRAIRVTRVARICQFFPELRTMVAGMLGGVRSVMLTYVILVVVTYTFAVFLRQLGISRGWGEEHFGTVPRSFYTLLFVSLFPDNAFLMDQILEDSKFGAALYYFFLLLTAVTIMNMLIGILCDNVFQVSDKQKKKRNVEKMSKVLKSVILSMDKDSDRIVTKNEFVSILDNPMALQMLTDIGVDVDMLVSEADFIYSSETQAGMTFEELKEEILKFRNSSVATNGAVIATRRFMRFSLEQIAARLEDLHNIVVDSQPKRRSSGSSKGGI